MPKKHKKTQKRIQRVDARVRDAMRAVAAYQRNTVFPAVFHTLTFDHFTEFEFEFSVDNGEVCITATHAWMTPDRDEQGHMTIMHTEVDAKAMGQFLATFLLPNFGDGQSGVVGFTQEKRLAEAAAGLSECVHTSRATL